MGFDPRGFIPEMWDFDADEGLFLVCAGVVSIVLLIPYYWQLCRISALGSRLSLRAWLAVCPPLCLLLIYFVLQNYSDPDQVRGHEDYVTLFMCGGAAWVWIAAAMLPLLGISLRDDALERNNAAATLLALGVMVANTVCYAMANIGRGPTIWTTIVPALMASATLWIGLFAIQLIVGFSDTIALDRDLPTAVTLVVYLIASSAILGWAAAGDWHDWPSTFSDFGLRASPVIAVTVAAMIAVAKTRPSREFTRRIFPKPKGR
jgi:hypothetical protein